MDRREAVLRELNLYPQWVRRNEPAPVSAEQPVPIIEQLVAAPVVAPTPLAPALARAVALNEDGVSARTEKNIIQAGSSATTPASQVDKLDWAELKQQVRDCTACNLRAGCTQTVFGVGDEKADWLFVGEGPGADEDALGEPFVGQAGKLLDNMMMAIKLKRGKNVYIANIVKCRPPDNRNPAADEIAQCLPYLARQIELIQPKLIVALGKVASNALLGKEATLASLRGKLHDYRVETATGQDVIQEGESSHLSSIPHQTTLSHRVRTTIPLIVTYHPAYLLRSPSEKAKAWQDLLLAVQTMEKSV
jgi:DNA polymerase